MKNSITLVLLLTIILFFLGTITAVAQGGSPPPPPGDPSATPIDVGLALLAAAGGAYAVNKLRERKE